jgi:hypothetical protein
MRLLLEISTVFPSSGSSLKGRPSPFVRNVAVVVMETGPLHIVLEDIQGLFMTATGTVHLPTLCL